MISPVFINSHFYICEVFTHLTGLCARHDLHRTVRSLFCRLSSSSFQALELSACVLLSAESRLFFLTALSSFLFLCDRPCGSDKCDVVDPFSVSVCGGWTLFQDVIHDKSGTANTALMKLTVWSCLHKSMWYGWLLVTSEGGLQVYVFQ